MKIFSKQNIIPLAECFVFSSWVFIYYTCIILILSYNYMRHGSPYLWLDLDLLFSLFIILELILIIQLFNIFLFGVAFFLLYPCVNVNVLLYGAGFVSCCFLFIPSASRLYWRITGFNTGFGEMTSLLYIINISIAMLAYYSYISVYFNTGEKINKNSLGLISLTVISLSALLISEIILLKFPVSWVTTVSYVAFMTCIMISDKIRLQLTPRRLGWVFFVLSYCLFIHYFFSNMPPFREKRYRTDMYQ